MNTLQHQVAIALSLTVVTRDQDKQRYATIPLLFITGLFLALWQVWPIALRAIQAAVFTGKVLSIAFNTFCYVAQVQYV